ncbi:glycoside hydrolase family 64 protein [Trichoderma citrinoviride]|uniref:Glycoside hydrolase family 64 protein n=1 Tax=Trichoderma citrinoviride TaxID=58853 RepID=A0A2T4B168_9HYPO|nr:glycoside hydrolase family 64 protein [Trichoderma citrinoviride]PTB63050.1 glycoside hydrolase family 64 protein [Trichoderma citrinoviride]
MSFNYQGQIPPGKGFTIAHPAGQEATVTKDNTLNGTYHSNFTRLQAQRIQPLPLKIVNNFDGGPINAYIQGLDSRGAVVFITANGTLIYPSSHASRLPRKIEHNLAIPLPRKGKSLNMKIPIPLSSGRVYFCQGNLSFFMLDTGFGDGLVQPSVTNMDDPSASLHWGFIELTYTAAGTVYANISYVDFVGLILSMILSTKDDPDKPQITRGLRSDAVQALCDGLWNQTTVDGHSWLGLCVVDQNARPIRVLSPNYYHRLHQSAFEDYWNSYVDKVWRHYSYKPLTIDTQTPAGAVKCRVINNILRCQNDTRGYSRPLATDIWGCDSGPFGRVNGDNDIHIAVIPRLCAAFVRSTLLIPGGDVQPSLNSSHHYTVSPTHHYSRLVHELQVDGRGYAFSYDDVNPDGTEDASGLVASGNPDTLTVYVGSPPTD